MNKKIKEGEAFCREHGYIPIYSYPIHNLDWDKVKFLIEEYEKYPSGECTDDDNTYIEVVDYEDFPECGYTLFAAIKRTDECIEVIYNDWCVGTVPYNDDMVDILDHTNHDIDIFISEDEKTAFLQIIYCIEE